MSLGIDTDLLLAIAIVAAALALFVWHVISTTRRVGYLISESRVPRRYLLLGLAIGLGVIYFMRR
jgi:hypothetical protein